jgi:hypothetical protein
MEPVSQEAYAKPVIADYGTIMSSTAGQATGAITDANFPQGTPFADLTFS